MRSRSTIVLSVVLPLGAANAVAQVHTTQLELSGTINGGALFAAGTATYDASSPTNVTNHLQYDPLPPGYEPLAIITIINTWRCSAQAPAVNLADVTGGAFTFTRTIQIFDEDNSVLVGSFTLDGSLSTVDAENSTASVTANGTYSGPLGFTGITGYDQLMQQAGPGLIRGSYIQSFMAGATHLRLEANTEWSYAGSGQLPSDEISTLRLTTLSYNPDTRELDLAGTGFYRIPAPAGVAGTYVVGALLLSRRRRANPV